MFYRNFDVAEQLLCAAAYRHAKGIDRIGRVEVEHIQVFNIVDKVLGIKAASCEGDIGDTQRRSLRKGGLLIKLIIFCGIAAVNVIEQVTTIVLPVIICKQCRYAADLFNEAFPCGNTEAVMRCIRYYILMFQPQFPKQRAEGVLPAARIGNVEYIFEPWSVA